MDSVKNILLVILFLLCLGNFAALLVFFNHLYKQFQSDQLDKAILRAISNGEYRNSYRYRPRRAKK